MTNHTDAWTIQDDTETSTRLPEFIYPSLFMVLLITAYLLNWF